MHSVCGEPVNRILIYVFAAFVGQAGAYWGRYRFPLKRESRMDRILGAINVFCNAGLCLLAMILPLTTDFVGIPALAFIAAALFLSSLFLYRVKVMDLRTRLASNDGRRALPADAQAKTRWPYTLVYVLGYAFMAIYIATINGTVPLEISRR